jgi:hypothetical protein
VPLHLWSFVACSRVNFTFFYEFFVVIPKRREKTKNVPVVSRRRKVENTCRRSEKRGWSVLKELLRHQLRAKLKKVEHTFT